MLFTKPVKCIFLHFSLGAVFGTSFVSCYVATNDGAPLRRCNCLIKPPCQIEVTAVTGGATLHVSQFTMGGMSPQKTPLSHSSTQKKGTNYSIKRIL